MVIEKHECEAVESIQLGSVSDKVTCRHDLVLKSALAAFGLTYSCASSAETNGSAKEVNDFLLHFYPSVRTHHDDLRVY